MQAAKKFWVWIVIGVVILAALAFDLVHVRAVGDRNRKENQSIVDKTNEFNRFVGTMRKKVPTPKDMEIGRDFMDAISAEGRRTGALWQQYATTLDQGIVSNEVIYPADDQKNAGKPVSPKFFADFLRPQYLKAMVDMELGLQKEMVPAWAKILAQSLYATNYRLTTEKAEAEGKESAPVVAMEQAHIVTPNLLIPFKLTEPFEQDQQKRWRYWRNFVIFRDILTRAVVKSVAQVKREVIAFERAPADFDDITGKLPTMINDLNGGASRFLENISKLEVTQIAVGDGELPSFAPVEGGEKKAAAHKGSVFYDVFSVKVELTGQIKVIEAFAREVPNTEAFYYVPVSKEIVRLADADTMGEYTMPTGEHATAPVVGEAYAETPATGVNTKLAFEHEPPVKALLVFHVYRPRTTGAANPDTTDTDKPTDERR